MQFGLKQSYIDQISSFLAKVPDVEKAVIFGSRAKGNFKPGSDIDIALFGEKLNTRHILKLAEMADDSYIPNMVDFIIYQRLKNKDLIDHIDRVGKLIYKKNNDLNQT